MRRHDSPGEVPQLRLLKGDGERRFEPLASRDAVARALIEAGAGLLTRRISPSRVEAIERHVEEVLQLFDRVDREPMFAIVLERKLKALEAMMRETRDVQAAARLQR